MTEKQDYITPISASNLSDLFYERVKRSAEKIACQYFNQEQQQWIDLSWNDIASEVRRWHNAFRHEGLQKGDRVAIMMSNCPDWVIFDQAAYSLGLVVVPVYTNDRAENIRYILEDADVKIFFIQDPDRCDSLLNQQLQQELPNLKRIVTHANITGYSHPLLKQANDWLPSYTETIERVKVDSDDLATIVYTSGTTGRPKGVMLSHYNIFLNAYSGAIFEYFDENDLFLSFLPLSHMFERTAGYYMPMVIGARIAYARSIEDLAEDLINIAPTILVTVPRIFERVYNKIQEQLSHKSFIARKLFSWAVNVGWHRFLRQQKRASWHPKLLFLPLLNKLVASKIIAKLGGRLRIAISGGAALSPEIARTFIGLGLTISQGYGLTETSPIVCTNKLNNNDPFSVGQPLPNVEVKLGEDDELLVKGPTVMMGYWHNEEATRNAIDSDGWFHSGDRAKIENGHIYITGRIKEIIVMSNGEKVPPTDIEMNIARDPLFDQVMVLGEARPYLSAIIVLNKEAWQDFSQSMGVTADASSLKLESVDKALLQRVNTYLDIFPGYAKIIRAHFDFEPWEVDNGLITPTLKLKRRKICEKYAKEIEELYRGH